METAMATIAIFAFVAVVCIAMMDYDLMREKYRDLLRRAGAR